GSSTRQRSSSGSAAPGENQYHGRPDSGMPWDEDDSFISQERQGKSSSPDETPEEKLRILRQQNIVRDHNKEVLKNLHEGESVLLSIISAGAESNVFLGGKFQKYYKFEGVQIFDARLRMVRKGGFRGPGKVTVAKIHREGHKALVKRELKEVTDKRVSFI
ncbi:hypothetical protein ABZ069_37750, partial [Streptomyces microflavus]|uniref:hypothetical protein n=1 Tax=Streptomyces microflavus TaxID=1919 RepID=UPI0033BF07B9